MKTQCHIRGEPSFTVPYQPTPGDIVCVHDDRFRVDQRWYDAAHLLHVDLVPIVDREEDGDGEQVSSETDDG